jgi:flagellar motor switch protein FliN
VNINILDNTNIKLSLSNLETLRYWTHVLMTTLYEKSGLEISIEECSITTKEENTKFDHYDFSVTSNIENNSSVWLLNQNIILHLGKEVMAKEEDVILDDMILSVANVNLNELFQRVFGSSSLKISPIDYEAIQSKSNQILIEFKFREKLQLHSIVGLMSLSTLLNFLNQNAHANTRNLDLMLGVPFLTTVELGKVTKTIKEIIEFTPGTIIELDKSIHEPLDVIVNSNMIARGVLIEISGNYGIEITQISQNIDKSNM